MILIEKCAGARHTCHHSEDLLHQLQVVHLVELRRELAALKRLADLEQQAESRVRDVPLRRTRRRARSAFSR